MNRNCLIGFRCAPMERVRIGFIGVGARGVRAVERMANIEGTEIVHSHPYNPSNAHSHTRGHILILSNSLNHDAPVVETTASCEVFLTEVRILHEETISPAIEPTSLCFALRAPPAKA